MKNQITLRTPVSIEGIGLHTGHNVRATFRPASEDHGIVFRRTDHPGLKVPALPESALGFDHATTLGAGGVQIGTVEHALSAAYGLGIDNLEIDVFGDELPILDGSAMPFVRLFQAAGLERQRRAKRAIAIARRREIRRGDKSITVRPGRGLTITYEIDFPHRAIGHQSLTIEIAPEAYSTRIAPARTFGFTHEIHYLRERGLVRGGSLQNAIVLDENNILSGPLRYADEFVRHKILDLVGDLALLGRRVEGRIHARRAGHALHAELVRELATEESPLPVAATAGFQPTPSFAG
jgi:UDP-3-O-[3-hydroxymyristoyl] N-acetylglucosamine deacetylase